MNEINSNAEKNVKLMIIGNKSDSKHEVDSETVKVYISYFKDKLLSYIINKIKLMII
jgi:hypothetical protein